MTLDPDREYPVSLTGMEIGFLMCLWMTCKAQLLHDAPEERRGLAMLAQFDVETAMSVKQKLIATGAE